MQIGMIGLGRMGANIARRLMHHGHGVVVFDQTPAAVAELAGDGAAAAKSIDDLLSSFKPRAQCGSCCQRATPPKPPSNGSLSC